MTEWIRTENIQYPIGKRTLAQCRHSNMVYRYEVTRNDNNSTESYTGSTVEFKERHKTHKWSKWMMTPMDPPYSAHTLSPSRVTMSNTPSIGHVWRELHHSMQSQDGAGSVHWNVTIYFSVQREPHWTRDQNFFHTASTKNLNYF